MPVRASTDWLAQQVDWLHEVRQEILVETVTYVQGGVAVDVEMTPMRADRVLDDEGAWIDVGHQDWVASPTQFKERELVEPRRGDRIIREVSGNRIEYEVIGEGNEPAYRPTDRYWPAWRIHSQVITRADSLPIRPCPSVFVLSTQIATISAGFRTSPAAVTFSTVGPTVVIG